MGLFSDTCTTLVDRNTGRALTGDALLQAKKDPKWPRCGYSVKKKARFCSKCGHGGAGGWWKCPGCGNWVGNESNFCWSCKTPLHPESRDDFAGGVWQKPADAFAQRFEVGDLKALLQKGIHVQAGTSAILLDSGAFKDVIGPGRHTLDNLGHKINWWGNPPPRTVSRALPADVRFVHPGKSCKSPFRTACRSGSLQAWSPVEAPVLILDRGWSWRNIAAGRVMRHIRRSKADYEIR